MNTTDELPTDQAVTWSAHAFGLTPALPAVDDTLRQADVGSLLGLLDDPDRFVTGHVLLTWASGVRHEAFPTWNGLAVDIRADGSVDIDPAQREDLRRRWHAWAAADPRPDELPAR
ncbi:hypothetical protein [Myceligenerans crystallogenes]|uniref:Uncharacterized protein n=1 Tax=Myceligenerans crystallogenes TaxID=316335 RepID=A0ABP4ZH83_9MICO